MKDLIKVKDHENLRRDPQSGAIVNINKHEYDGYLKRRQKSEQIDYLEQKVDNLQGDIKDIKQILKQLVSK